METLHIEMDDGEVLTLEVEDKAPAKEIKSSAKMPKGPSLTGPLGAVVDPVLSGAYNLIKEPMTAIAANVAPIPKLLAMAGDKQVLPKAPEAVDRLLSPISPAYNAYKAIQPRTGRELGHDVAGLGVDVLLAEGALGAASKASKLGGVVDKTKKMMRASDDLAKANVKSEEIYQSIESLKDNLKPAAEALNNAAIDDAVLYKNKLRPISKQNSEIYKKGLKAAEESANLTQSKVKSILDSSMDEAIEQGVSDGSPLMAEMRKISEELSATGQKVWDSDTASYVMKQTDEAMTIEQLRNLKTRLFKVADKSSDHADEVGNAIFMKNYGNEIAGQSPAFQVMQQEYAPYVEAKKWAYRTFKPFTKDQIPNGNRVLRAIAKGTAKAEDFAYLKRLEHGSGRFKGTGEMRSKSQSMADQLMGISDEIKELRRAKVQNAKDVERLKGLIGLRNKIVVTALGVLGAGATVKSGYNLIKEQF